MVTKKKTIPNDKNIKPSPAKTRKSKLADPAASINIEHSRDFPVVALGASAGGLEAIEKFFSFAPSDINAAFVIIQHLAPDHKSLMASLLDKYTKMKTVQIEDQMPLETNCVYLNPPDRDVSISNGKFHLIKPIQARTVRLPIDYFLRSLADSHGEKSIGIILSGTGSDGTLGIKAIKEVGGMVMAQDETQALYNGMPKSAIDTGLVDYILPVEKMADELTNYIKNPFIGRGKKKSPKTDEFDNYLQKIFILIRSSTGHNFSHYKTNTIRRRIERRMAVHHIDDISQYVRYLQDNPPEIKPLFKDFLITVTNFFRDPDAFNTLYEKTVLPLMQAKKLDTNIRIWVAGCATGEEAYSIAMLFCEAMETMEKSFNLQIFATDIDPDAVEQARQGIYPENIAADVSAERLNKFFTKKGGTYQIKKYIREMIVFAVQDLIKDPPFSKLDLVCCRNVLIYMDSTLQKKIMPLFHYTLNHGGFLFLGTSESIGDFADAFSPVDAKWKIFQRKDAFSDIHQRPITPFYDISTGILEAGKTAAPAAIDIRQMAEKTILQNYAPPSVLIDEKFDIVYFHGETDKYLAVSKGEPSFNILKMAREDIRYKLNDMLRSASKEKNVIVSKDVKIRYDDKIETVDVTVRPVLEPAGMKGFMMVAFEAKSPAAKTSTKKKTHADKSTEPRIAALKQELASTKEYLQTTIEQLETSNEELNSNNEEMQSINEELQSTNEELETSREELQSTNEELNTLNSELQNKVEQLTVANDDLSNLLSSTEIATIFLDNDFITKRFTTKMTDFFKLIPTDIGRPISDINHNLKYDDLLKDSKDVLKNLVRIEKEIESKDGKSLKLQIIPYRSLSNVIEGVVINLVDITAEKTNITISLARDYAQGIVATTKQPLVVLDSDLKVISANRSFYNIFDITPAQTVGILIYELANHLWDIPELRKLLEEILPQNTEFNDFEIVLDIPKIGKKKMILNARRIFQGIKSTETILLGIENITDL